MQFTTTTLRPLGMGELFDRAIRLYRNNFLRFIGVIAAMQIPLSYETTIDAIPSPNEIAGEANPFALLGEDYYTSLFIGLLVTVVYLIFVSGIASAALTRMAADSYLGAPPSSNSIFDAFEAIGDRWGPLVKSIFLYLALIGVGVIWTVIPCFGWLTGPGLLLTMAGMVLPLVAPVVVLENHNASKSIRRAWELVRGRFWWVFGFMILLYLFNWVVVGGPSLLSGAALSFILPEQLAGDNPQLLYNIQVSIQAIINMIFNILYLPLQLSCLTLVYFDLRVRQEGLDLTLAAAQETRSTATIIEQVANSAPTAEGPVVQGKELTYFAGLSASIFILYLAIVFAITFVVMAATSL
jgi:hypothetical protein